MLVVPTAAGAPRQTTEDPRFEAALKIKAHRFSWRLLERQVFTNLREECDWQPNAV